VDGNSIVEKELKEKLASTAESPENLGLQEDLDAVVGEIFRCIDLYRKFIGSAKDQISLDEIDRIINTSFSTLDDIFSPVTTYYLEFFISLLLGMVNSRLLRAVPPGKPNPNIPIYPPWPLCRVPLPGYTTSCL